MRKLKKTILIGLFLLGVYDTSFAAEETVVIVGTKEDTWDCSKATTERARWLADKASRDGDFQRAGECYVAAGQPGRANSAFIKATGPASADTSRQFTASAEQVKAQARQLKHAFQRH